MSSSQSLKIIKTTYFKMLFGIRNRSDCVKDENWEKNYFKILLGMRNRYECGKDETGKGEECLREYRHRKR